MLPDDRRHGTYAGAQAHIRTRIPMCEPCHESHLRYRRRRRHDRQQGLYRMVSTEPVIRHLEGLRNQGVTVRAIAERAGVSDGLIDELLNRPRALIRSDNADALLATSPPPVPTGQVPAIGTIRRIQALGRVGWSMKDIAAASGVRLHTMRRISSEHPPHVTTGTAQGIAAAFEALCMTVPPLGRTSSQVRAKAAQKGWLPPLAWDAIDDPDEQPSGGVSPAHQRTVQLIEDAEWLAAADENLTNVCERLAVNAEALYQACRRAQRLDLYAKLSRREPNGDLAIDMRNLKRHKANAA